MFRRLTTRSRFGSGVLWDVEDDRVTLGKVVVHTVGLTLTTFYSSVHLSSGSTRSEGSASWSIHSFGLGLFDSDRVWCFDGSIRVGFND